MKIGVFDSGVGGLSVAQAIERELPDLEVIFVNDSKHLPYGTKTPAELLGYVVPILRGLEKEGCAVIVIACNTVTTTLISQLREVISVSLVGIEPMVKPAAEQTVSKIIAVCATPTTLASKRYHELKEDFAQGITVLEPDCSDWSYLIENNQLNHQKIANTIKQVCDAGADVIVLGCTHYHWIQEQIEAIAADRAVIIQPESATVAQLKRVIERLA